MYFATKISGYDSRVFNDVIGKAITPKLLGEQSVLVNLSMLRDASQLQLKPIYIERIEQACLK